MAGSIGVVRQVVGEVFAVAADGSRRLLTEGDRVFAGEQLVTGAQGAVAVALANGQELVLGRDSSMPLNNALLAGAPDATQPGTDSAPATPSQQDLTDVEKLQAAIEAGVDPTKAAEATAAGPGGGAGGGNAGGGHSFVLLGETAGSVDPNIGFPTGPIAFAVEFPQPDTGIPDIPLVVPAVVPVNGVPTAVVDTQSVSEGQDGVQGNVLDNDDGGPDLPTTFMSWQAPGAIGGPGGSLLLNTPYGVVTLNPDGSYSFVLNNGTPAVEGLAEGQSVNISVGYGIQDSNGDQSTANLIITIVGSNDIPTVEVSFPDAEGGVAQVFEKGLADGSSAGDGSTVTTGSFTVADSDGLANLKTLSVGSLTVDLTTSGFASLVGQSFTTAHGTVLITGYSDGSYSFSYTLTGATADAAGPETDGFLINVGDGLATASASVSIEIVDDVPTATPDSGSLTENGEPSSLSGNVLNNDTGGADQPKAFTSWNGVAGATPGEGGSLLVNTPYGVVTLNADGSYSFVLANGSAAVEALTEGQQVTLQYAYSMQDGDGDPSSSTLTITITGSNDIPTIEVSSPNAEGDLAQVFEKGLADGSSAGDGSTVTTGSFTVADSDGLANLKTLSVGSLTVDLTTNGFASLVGQSFTTAHGTVSITGYSDGSYSFSYTLTGATADAAGPETDGFLINVGDGLATASASVRIEIVDDVPTATPDSGSLTENGEPSSLSGNVLDNDTGGADQPKAFTSWNGVAGATPGEGGSLLVNTPYGVVTLNADGSYSFVLANGSAAVEALTEGQQVTLQYAYSMQDGDGDPSNSTLTITIVGSNDIPTIEVSSPDAEGDLAQVFEKGLTGGSSAGDGSTVTTGSFTVADSDGLANLKTLSVGSLTVDLTTNGFASLVGQSFTTAHGTVLITGYSDGSYSFSYTLTGATADAAGPETDGFLINVGDGLATASATVTIEIVDDVPQAKADSASVSEGASVTGNVVTGAGLGSVADAFGADGRPSPTTGVVGVRAGGDTSTPIAGGVGDSITSAFGTLVLHADGSYTYTSHANSLAQAGTVDTFTYTIVDGDGDFSTTTLTIDVSNITVVGGVQAGSDDDVREAALGFGSEPASNDEFASGSLVANGGNGPYSFSLGVGAGNGQYGQLVVNSNGSYTYTLLSAPKVNPGNNGNNLQFTETFTFQVVDANGNTGTGTLTIDIVDDVPSISVKGTEGFDLQVDETTLGVADSSNFAGAFLPVFGADGAALSNPITYSLEVKSPGVDSGLRDTATGNSILLFKEGTDIVGRVVGGGQLAFRLSVAADGTVTLEQSRAIFHTPNTGPDQAVGLSDSDLITLTATITDGDGDKNSASLDLGNAISFRDDAPNIDPYVKVSLDDDALPHGNPYGVGDNSPDTSNTSGIIAHDFGADGPGGIELQASGAPYGFTYVEVAGGLVIKQGDVTVITITLDKLTGAYSVTQNAPIMHPEGDDENDLTFEVEYKIVDRDGDRAGGSLYIKVDDDSPVVSTSPVVQLDDDALPGGNAYGIGDVSPDTANVTGTLGHSFGADGPGSVTLLTSGAPAGFSYEKSGDNLLIKQGGLTVITLALNWATGAYSVVQNNPIMHPDGYDENDLSFSIAYKVTDADGDSATGSLIINVDDDTPKAYADSASIVEGSVSATLGGNVLDNDAGGADQPKAFTSWNGVAGATPGDNGSLLVNTPYGVVTLNADGSYSFALANGSAAVEALAPGEQVVLHYAYSMRDADGDASDSTLTLTIIGSNDTPTVEVAFPEVQGGMAQVYERGLPDGSSAGDGSTQVNGTFSVGDPDGLGDLKSMSVGSLNVDLTTSSFSSLVGQGFTTDHGTVQITGYSSGTYSFSYTLTEATTDAAGPETDGFQVTVSDGVASASATATIEIVDDVPNATPDSRGLTENGSPASVSGNVLDNDVGGADQPKSFTSWNGVVGATPGDNGSLLVNTPYGVVTLHADGSYSFALANGSAAVEGLDQGEQVTLQYAYSMRDADQDPSSSTLTITITGSNDIPTVDVSTPSAGGDMAKVYEKGLPDGSSAGDGSNITTGSFTVGDADGLTNLKTLSVGSLTVDLTTSSFSSLVGQSFSTDHGTVQITSYSNGTYSFSYTLTEATTDAAGPDTDGFQVTVNDGLANDSANVSIEIVDDVPNATPDSRGLTENGSPASVSGNVLDNDVGGADQPKTFTSWNGVVGATPGDNGSLLVNTPYGVVTLHADGSYSFALANGSAAVEGLDQGEQVTLQYAYSMRDADQDPSSSTLTITITGSNDIPTVDVSTPSAGGDMAKVYEKGLPDGSSAGDGSNITTGSFTVGDADGLTNLKTLSVGSLTVDLTTSSFSSLVGQSFSTDHGTVQITSYSNGTYSFSYTLTEATTDAAGPETDGFQVSVNDGLASASATATIEIVDDLSKAKADSASVSEGGSVNGNVVSGAGLGSVADVFGADGRPSPTTGVVGVRTGGDTTTAASGSVGVPIDTGLGTLVLHADGSYTYTSHANSVGQAGAVDTFTYTIVDADGDLSTTTLTINVSNYTVVGSVQAASDQDVREAALSFGSTPSSNDEFASGTLVGSGGNGPYSFSLGVGAGTGQYGQLVLDSNGSYTYSLLSAPKVNPGDNGNNLQFTETFTFQVTDANGNTGTGILTVSIVDDVPDISVEGLGALGVQVDETVLNLNASTSFAGAFTAVFGADGAAASNATTYSLDVKLPGVDSGLRDTATGNSILLSKVGSDIVGVVSGGGQVAFRLSVAADGTVTLDQQRAIVHSPDSGPDQVAGLSSADLITLTATITDGDGDKDSATLDLGSAISFRDDAPAVSSNVVVQLDDDALPGGIADGSGDDPDSANTTGSVGFDFGADGAGDVQWLTMGAPDGFTYLKSGTTLLIKQGTTTVIEVTLNSSTGAYGVTQLAPIQHAPAGEENDQLFTLTYKVTDKDGDSTNGTLDIKVDDDTPQGKSDSADVAEGSGQDFNVVFVLDFSGSIDNTELNTMLNAVRNAGQALFGTTDGDVRIQLVAFSGTAASYPVVTDVTAFTNLVNSLNPAEGGARPFSGNTDFTAAIQQTMAVYTPLSSWSNQVFFISDGNPNEQTGPGDTSLTSAVATQWNSFVDDNGINVTTIGVGNGINTPRLQDVDVDGSGAPIMVSAFEDLVETLASQIVGGVVSGNVLLGSDNAVGGGDDDAFGADGAGRIQSIQIGATTYTWNGASTISLSTGGTLSGSLLNAITTPGGGKLSFDFTTGAWTYVAPKNVAADTSESFTYNIIDKDGDPSSASLTVRIEDASPVIGRVDEDELPSGITDGDAQATVVTGNLGELLVGTPVGAQFSVAATPQAMPVLTSDGVAITYSRVDDTLVAKAGADTVFTLQVASNGVYTFSLLGALDHPSGAGGDDQILTLNLTGALQASNGSGNLPLAGDLLIQVEDDIPAILQTSNLVFSNGDSVAGASGVFVYSTGGDTRGSGPFSASDSDFTAISLSGTVGGVAISSSAVTWVSESATSASFDITFNYAPNPASPGTLEQANGTLTFDKVNGTYSVAMDEPIQGFTIFKTSTSLSITGYEVNSTVPDSTQPAVAVVELDNDFFVQYTSYAEPGGGTGSNNLLAGTSTTSTFTDGELFSQAASWVSVSNSDNGVAGDTLGKGEVLDLNFYTSNPKGNLGVEPSARAEGMFLKFDGVNGEDLVVVLKLVGAGGAKTTRALVVSSTDIMTANSVALAAYGIVLDNNDGAIVIEKSDFNAPGENWQIYGAQILTSVEGISSSAAINFNSTIGAGGASDVSDRLTFTSSATDNDVLKVSDVGFITAEANTLDTSLNFQVGVRDADGDTSPTQALQVDLEASTTFVGTASDDVIQGTSGNDHLTGLAGNDVLVGGAGNDILDGGLGTDTASYFNAASSVAVNLALTGQQNTGGGGLDTLIDVENLLGSRFDDVLAGNSGNNVLAGNGGNDQLSGGAGADTFKWLPGETGITTINDFTPGVDKLDLSQLLTGEHSNVGSLDDYLTMAFGANTTITVDSNTAAAAGGTGQTVVLQGVNLMAAYGAPDAASVISHMLDDGSLKVDA